MRATSACLVARGGDASDAGISAQHGSYVSRRFGAGIATREAFDEAFHEHELPLPDADLPTAPASDVPTPSTVAEADSSEHAAIWRNSRTREFRGLLQANTFGPT